jgi:formate--tetrahydrofolate ligase
MNIKGTAAGGGNSLLIPMTEFSLGLTGDINDIANAHNLCMVALNARMQHEYNYDDETLAKRNLKRLDIDANRVEMGWVIDFAASAAPHHHRYRRPADGFMMSSRFAVTVGSELMAIMAVANGPGRLKTRIGESLWLMIKKETPSHRRFGSDGAMAAWKRNTINPTCVRPRNSSRACGTPGRSPILPSASPPSSGIGWV